MATTFTNQATLTYNGEEVLSNIAVGVLESSLSVTKSAVSPTYEAGGTVTYVVSIVNRGAAAELTVADDLGAFSLDTGTVQPLTYVDGSVQVYRDGVLQDDPFVDTADGLRFIGVSVAAGGSVLIIYAASVNAFAPLESGSVITNTVAVSGEVIREVTAQETVTVGSAARLSVIKSISPIPVAENERLTYTFRLINSGNTAVETTDNAVITDVFDPILTDIVVTFEGVVLTEGIDYTYNEAIGLFETAQGVIAIPAATYAQDPVTGEQTTTPGAATLTVTGNVA